MGVLGPIHLVGRRCGEYRLVQDTVTSAAGVALPPIRLAVERARQEALRRELDGCQLLAGIWCHGFTGRPRPTASPAAVYEGRLYGPDDFAQLEAMPTRVQSYQYLLGCLQMPAVSVLAALRARQEAMAQAEQPPAEEAAPAPAPEQ
uniref:Uncharacterized protein n=1 Tax=Aegilops tauschii TaxID=37682 RepID=N1R1E7_AEGTA